MGLREQPEVWLSLGDLANPRGFGHRSKARGVGLASEKATSQYGETGQSGQTLQLLYSRQPEPSGGAEILHWAT